MIIRRRRNSRFSVIPNEIAEDRRLSIEARWLMVYLLTKPENWEVRIPDIQGVARVGRDKAYRMVKECIDARYIDREVERDHRGQVLGHVYIVRDEPASQPLPEKAEVVSQKQDGEPLPENPYPAEPDPGNTDHSKDGQQAKTKTTPKRTRAELDALENALREAGGRALNEASPNLMIVAEPLSWLAAGCDLDLDVLPAIRARVAKARDGAVHSWAFFTAVVCEARDRRLQAHPVQPIQSGRPAPPGAKPSQIQIAAQRLGIRLENERPSAHNGPTIDVRPAGE